MKSVLRYELDEFGKVGITLEEFDSLEEMDLFMKKFSDSNGIKERYFETINEFLKTKKAKEFLDMVTTRENNGYIRGYTSNKYRYVHIPLIYQSSIVNEKECFKRLRENLPKKSVLYDIYHHKFFLLPQEPTLFLKDELRYCVVHHGTNRIFIKEFIHYIESLSMQEKYFVFRSLCDKCHLLDIEKNKSRNLFKIRKDNNGYKLIMVRHYNFGDYSDNELNEMTYESNSGVSLRNEADDKFSYSFDNKDMEYILENYDIDEIDRNTNYFDQEETKRRGK